MNQEQSVSDLNTFTARAQPHITSLHHLDSLYLEPTDSLDEDGTLQFSENGTVSDNDLKIYEIPSRKISSNKHLLTTLTQDCTFQQKDLVDALNAEKKRKEGQERLGRIEEQVTLEDKEGNYLSAIEDLDYRTDELAGQIRDFNKQNQIIELKPVSLSEENSFKTQPKKVLVPKIHKYQKQCNQLNKSYEIGNRLGKVFQMNLTIVNQRIRISPRKNKRTLSANIIPHKSPSQKQCSNNQLNLQNFLFSGNISHMGKDTNSSYRMVYRDNSSTNTTSRPVQKQLRIKVLPSAKSSERPQIKVSPLKMNKIQEKVQPRISPLPEYFNKEYIPSIDSSITNSRNNSYRQAYTLNPQVQNQFPILGYNNKEEKVFINFHNHSFQAVQPPMILQKNIQNIQDLKEQLRESQIKTQESQRDHFQQLSQSTFDCKENLNMSNRVTNNEFHQQQLSQKKTFNDLCKETLGLMNDIKTKQHSKFIDHIRQRQDKQYQTFNPPKLTNYKPKFERIKNHETRGVTILEQKQKVDCEIDRILQLLQSKLH